MARKPEGPKLKWPGGKPGSGLARVRFTFKSRRYDEPTGTSDPEEAERLKWVIHSDIVSGRVKKTTSGALIHPGTELVVLVAKWIVAIRSTIGRKTDKTYTTYGRHWSRSMPTIGDVTEAGLWNYQSKRFGEVVKVTYLKERTALKAFLSWCKAQAFISELPTFPPVPKKSQGTRHKSGRRAPVTVMTPAEVELCISGHAEPDFFIVCWETALRPDSTVPQLQPSDLLPNYKLSVRGEVDKNGATRVISVSPRAYEAMKRSLPFGFKHRLAGWKAACMRAIGRAENIYSLKHARITWWVNQGMPIGGVSRLTGVSRETLLKRYALDTDEAADRIIWGDSGKPKETSNVVPLRKPGSVVARVGFEGTEDPQFTEENANGSVSKSANSCESKTDSGLPHQITPAEFRARSAAWFRRSA